MHIEHVATARITTPVGVADVEHGQSSNGRSRFVIDDRHRVDVEIRDAGARDEIERDACRPDDPRRGVDVAEYSSRETLPGETSTQPVNAATTITVRGIR